MTHIPSLINFSEKVQQAFENRLVLSRKGFDDLSITYRQFINDMKILALKSNAYWTFDLNIVSENDVRALCELNTDIFVSQQWRLAGSLQDLINLAKLAGYHYEPQGREMTLPGFEPEASYWIMTLQMIKLCRDGSPDPDVISPCSKKAPLLWNPEPIRFCHCCTQGKCRPLSRIEPVKICKLAPESEIPSSPGTLSKVL